MFATAGQSAALGAALVGAALYAVTFAASGDPAPTVPAASKPVPLIFDTDVGNDIDDAMALGVIHALQDRGECKLLAVTVTKDNPHAAPYIDCVNTFYGRGDIPIGVVRKGVTPHDGRYNKQVATRTDGGKFRYPHDLLSGADAPEAAGVLRQTLAAAKDGEVVVLQVGFATNLARLLDTKGDKHSPLDGVALVRKKVRLLSMMAGNFSTKGRDARFAEYNIKMDVHASRKLLANWPTPIVLSGWEIGEAIRYPGVSIQRDYLWVKHHPVREAYEFWGKMPYDRPTYDLTSVLYAVRPDRGYFGLSGPGRVRVDDDKYAAFTPAPAGPHRYLTVTPQQIAQVREALVMLCSQPPGRLAQP